MPKITDYSNYEKDYTAQVEMLKSSIQRITTRQTEILTHINDLAAEKNNFMLALNDPTTLPAEKSKLHGIVARATELIATLYETVAQFEATRFNYQKELIKLSKDKNYFLYIDMRTIEEKLNHDNNDVSFLLSQLQDTLREANNLKLEKKINIDPSNQLSDPMYSMN